MDTNKKNIKWIMFGLITLIFAGVTAYAVVDSLHSVGDRIGYTPWKYIIKRMLLIIPVYAFLILHCFIEIKKLYEFIFKKRLLIAVILFVYMVLNKFNYSSMGMYNNVIQTQNESEFSRPLIGKERPVRSDEWLVGLTRCMSTDKAGVGRFNDIIMATESKNVSASGISASYYGLAQPIYWGYILFGSEYGVAWLWNFFMIFGFLAWFELMYILTEKKKLVSLFGAALIWFSQYNMWWSVVTQLFAGALAVVCFYYLINAADWKKRILPAIGTGIFFANFVVAFYPAWQVPMGLMFLGLVIWIIIKQKEVWKKFKWQDIIVCLGFVAFALSLIVFFILDDMDYIKSIGSTVYPGKRTSSGGNNSLPKLLSYYSSLLFPFSGAENQSEISTIYAVFPIAPMLAIWVLIKKKGRDLLLWILLGLGSFMTVYCTVGLPGFLAKITVMSNTVSYRAIDVLALICAIMLVVCYGFFQDNRSENRMPIWLSIVFTMISAFAALIYEKFSGIKTIYMILILGLAAFTVIVQTLILSAKKDVWSKMGIIFSTILILLTGLYVNPVMYGTGVIKDKPLASKVNEIVEEKGSEKWIAVSSDFLPNFLIACGARTYNSVNYVPNMELWKKIDEKGEYEEIYNRYAHVIIIMTEDETRFTLNQQDKFTVYLSYSDMAKLDVSYICSAIPLETANNYGYTEIYSEDEVYIYYKDSEGESA